MTARDGRESAGLALAADAGAVTDACYAMARRFHAGGKLLVFGSGTSATDAAHIAVEFVHPVVVGKRALPAMSLTNDVATVTGLARDGRLDDIFAAQLRLHGRPGDIALGVAADARDVGVRQGLAAGRSLGMLTVAMVGGAAGTLPGAAVDHVLPARSDDPLVVKEIQVTTYHILWELVHVFFEQPGVLTAEVVA